MIWKHPSDTKYFMFLGEVFRLDPDDKLVMQNHERWPGILRITHTETKRFVEVSIVRDTVELMYLDPWGQVSSTAVSDGREMGQRSVSFLNNGRNGI